MAEAKISAYAIMPTEATCWEKGVRFGASLHQTGVNLPVLLIEFTNFTSLPP